MLFSSTSWSIIPPNLRSKILQQCGKFGCHKKLRDYLTTTKRIWLTQWFCCRWRVLLGRRRCPWDTRMQAVLAVQVVLAGEPDLAVMYYCRYCKRCWLYWSVLVLILVCMWACIDQYWNVLGSYWWMYWRQCWHIWKIQCILGLNMLETIEMPANTYWYVLGCIAIHVNTFPPYCHVLCSVLWYVLSLYWHVLMLNTYRIWTQYMPIRVICIEYIPVSIE